MSYNLFYVIIFFEKFYYAEKKFSLFDLRFFS